MTATIKRRGLDTEQKLCAAARNAGWRIGTRMPGYTRLHKGRRTIYVRYTQSGGVLRADLTDRPGALDELAAVGSGDKRKASTILGWLWEVFA